MTRFLVVAGLIAALLLAVPVLGALTCAALAPAALAPMLGGAADQDDPLPNATDAAEPRLAGPRTKILVWARAHVGQPYRMGATGPTAWDCSSFTQAAYTQVGVDLPRTAQQQRDWLATGHGTRIVPSHERPGDLIFWDSYLGPDVLGHVVLVDDPAHHRTVEAHNTRAGTGYFTYSADHQRYEIWRPHLRSEQRSAPPRRRRVS